MSPQQEAAQSADERLSKFMECAALMRDASEVILRAYHLNWDTFSTLRELVVEQIERERPSMYGYRFVVETKDIYLTPKSDRKLVGKTKAVHLHKEE